jgi:hypothetical protein
MQGNFRRWYTEPQVLLQEDFRGEFLRYHAVFQGFLPEDQHDVQLFERGIRCRRHVLRSKAVLINRNTVFRQSSPTGELSSFMD